MSTGVRINWWIMGSGIVVLVLLSALCGWGFSMNPRALQMDVMEGKPAPDFTLTTLKGDKVQLSSFRGRPVVINFWSTWCVPCKQEHPLLQRAPTLYPEATFLGIVYNDDEVKVRNYLRRSPVAYDQFMDPDGKVSIAFGVTGVPETFFIDKEGVIRHKVARALSNRDLAVTLQEMLQ